MDLDDFLAEASCLINGERQDTYGDISESWERIGRLWAGILDLDQDIPAYMVGIMMATMKLSRIAGSPEHTDSYIDALAYIAGAGELATE